MDVRSTASVMPVIIIITIIFVAGVFYISILNRTSGNSFISIVPKASVSTTISISSVSASSNFSTSTASSATTTIHQNTNLTMVAVPTNLSQLISVSTFRSCSGHDYSGYDAQGYLETNRSMKTYLQPKAQFIRPSTIPYFAPVNGTIVSLSPEMSFGMQMWIAAPGTPPFPQFGQSASQNQSTGSNSSYGRALGICSSMNLTMSQCQSYCASNPLKCGLSENFLAASNSSWAFVLFHIDPLVGLKVGSTVTAGNLIGYANLSSQHINFDMAYKKGVIKNGTLDSIFSHMSLYVLAQFAKHGVSQNSTILSKAYRDANPCTCRSVFQGQCIFSSSNNANGWVNFTS